MKNIYSVYQINSYIHKMFSEDYLLPDVCVQGEISNLKYHSSGHVYFTLKDEQSAISCAIFKQAANKLNIQLKDGDKIIGRGSINNYIAGGSVTFNITSVEYAGLGELTKAFEELKKNLSEQGLFDAEFKKPIPKFPKTIGVVTAPTGAAIRDIISVSKRRNPYISIILYPALVQGNGASDSIVNGIETLEKHGVDVIIIGRGGGSLEDLWAFNEEKVAYAVFQCSVPIISAVGHEIDFTISDFVSDMRAATPSAAAEIAVPDIKSVINDIDKLSQRLDLDINRIIGMKTKQIQVLETKLFAVSPANNLKKKRILAESYESKLDSLMKNKISRKRLETQNLLERLKGLSPLERLKAGMAYLTDEKGKRVSCVSDMQTGDKLKVIMKDGFALVNVENTVKEEF